MSHAHEVSYTYAEYLAFERENPARHEFLEGRIYAMAGGTPEHARLASEVMRVIGNALTPGCVTFNPDLRIRIASANLSTYPDGSVVCGKFERSPDDEDACINPRFVLEVTSKSTEKYDRGEKLAYYQSLASVREVLIVSHASPWLVLYSRTLQGWDVTEAREGESVLLVSPPCRLSVDQLYRDRIE